MSADAGWRTDRPAGSVAARDVCGVALHDAAGARVQAQRHRAAQWPARASLARPGGDPLERGGWQLANGQQAAAIITLEDVLRRFAASPVRPEATVLLHRAQRSATRSDAQIMETPNQPVAESMNILALWNEFFPARPGHWGGYEFTSYPRAADVTIGYSGAAVAFSRSAARRGRPSS
jgi:hypothetical protein